MTNFTRLYSRTLFLPLVAILVATIAILAMQFGANANETNIAEANIPVREGPSIVVLGDSLSAGYQLPPGDSYPEKLQAALDAKNIQARIVGAGVSGDTTTGGLARLAWSVPEETDGVILQLGANDALRGLPPKITKDNLSAMIEQLQERGIKVLLIGMLAPPNMGEDYEKAFNGTYAELAAQYNVPLYPFFLDGVMTVQKHVLDDGMHPNTRGVEVMVGKTLPKVEDLIEELRPTP